MKSLSAACQEVIPNDDREKIKKHGELFDYLQKIGKLSQGENQGGMGREGWEGHLFGRGDVVVICMSGDHTQ